MRFQWGQKAAGLAQRVSCKVSARRQANEILLFSRDRRMNSRNGDPQAM